MIYIENIGDNECFKWCLVTQLNPEDHNPAKITKADKDFVKKLDFEDIKFPVKFRNIQKTENQNSIGTSIFSYENNMYERNAA